MGREHTRSSPWVHRTDPAFPHAMVLTGSSALSSVIGLGCHRRLPFVSAKLDASVEASGPHDFAVRVSAVRQRHLRVHRIPSRVRDDRDTPLWWDETARTTVVICVRRKPKYFSKWGWTGKSVGSASIDRAFGRVVTNCRGGRSGGRDHVLNPHIAHAGYSNLTTLNSPVPAWARRFRTSGGIHPSVPSIRPDAWHCR
jgi:hypothetical protein